MRRSRHRCRDENLSENSPGARSLHLLDEEAVIGETAQCWPALPVAPVLTIDLRGCRPLKSESTTECTSSLAPEKGTPVTPEQIRVLAKAGSPEKEGRHYIEPNDICASGKLPTKEFHGGAHVNVGRSNEEQAEQRSEDGRGDPGAGNSTVEVRPLSPKNGQHHAMETTTTRRGVDLNHDLQTVLKDGQRSAFPFLDGEAGTRRDVLRMRPRRRRKRTPTSNGGHIFRRSKANLEALDVEELTFLLKMSRAIVNSDCVSGEARRPRSLVHGSEWKGHEKRKCRAVDHGRGRRSYHSSESKLSSRDHHADRSHFATACDTGGEEVRIVRFAKPKAEFNDRLHSTDCIIAPVVQNSDVTQAETARKFMAAPTSGRGDDGREKSVPLPATGEGQGVRAEEVEGTAGGKFDNGVRYRGDLHHTNNNDVATMNRSSGLGTEATRGVFENPSPSEGHPIPHQYFRHMINDQATHGIDEAFVANATDANNEQLAPDDSQHGHRNERFVVGYQDAVTGSNTAITDIGATDGAWQPHQQWKVDEKTKAWKVGNHHSENAKFGIIDADAQDYNSGWGYDKPSGPRYYPDGDISRNDCSASYGDIAKLHDVVHVPISHAKGGDHGTSEEETLTTHPAAPTRLLKTPQGSTIESVLEHADSKRNSEEAGALIAERIRALELMLRAG